jgi:hypothetical protein
MEVLHWTAKIQSSPILDSKEILGIPILDSSGIHDGTVLDSRGIHRSPCTTVDSRGDTPH